MSKKDSIIFQITIFFIAIFITINTLFIIQFKLDSNAYNVLEIKRYLSSFRIVEDSRMDNISNEEINKKIANFDMKLADISFEELMNSNYQRIKLDDDVPIDIYIHNKIKYVHFNPKFGPFSNNKPPEAFLKPNNPLFFPGPPPPKPEKILLIDDNDGKQFKYFWLIILFLVDLSLVWFFLFIRKKLLPLYDLKEHMIELSKGNFKISTKTDKKDEISQVANEFDNAIFQLRQLRESRNLFLRNIMHELKTPITKGKLISDILEEDDRKYTLIRVFHRLEYLLSEFAKIEELTSGKIQLDKNQYHVIDLLEQAFDILLLDDDTIDIHDNKDLIVNVDFELFSIALKNLIDNAIKYNTNGNPEIFIEKDYIKIRNKGDKLKKDINEYYKPFNHEYETANDGLGLGLYISNNIIKINGLNLQYQYINGFHNFIITLN